MSAVFRPYVYRGTGSDTLTAFMDAEPVRHPGGRPATRPHGPTAAYRRHLRQGERPCLSCRQAEARYRADGGRNNERRRQRYAQAREEGLSPREALAARDRRTA